MRTGKIILAAFFLGASIHGAEPIKVQLTSYSLLFRPATYKAFGGITYVNEITSDSGYPISNGEVELAPPNVPYTHWGYFWYHDGITFETFTFDFALDVPGADANANMTWDILEYSQPVSARTSGEYFGDEDSGAFQCDWTKAANSYKGTCKITFDFGQAFTHQFEIIEYTGTWSDAVMSDGDGTVNLHLLRSGVDGEFIDGPLAFSIATQKLTVRAASDLKTQGGAAFKWNNDARTDLQGGKLFAFLDVIDGTPTTDPEAVNFEDFNDWQLMITDPNDANSNGIPDFLESSATPPAQPTLEIIKTTDGIRIIIHGEVGRSYILEDATAIPSADWLHPMTVNATAAETPIDLSNPSETIFWRARVLEKITP